MRPGCHVQGSWLGPTRGTTWCRSATPRVTQGVEGFSEVTFRRVATTVVSILDAARPIVRKPRIDIALPAVGELVLDLQPPGGVGEVVEGRIMYSLGVVALVENGVLGQLLREIVIRVNASVISPSR